MSLASGPRATFTSSPSPGTRAAASSSTPPTATCSWTCSTMSSRGFGWELFAWCLLGNHLHFVVRGGTGGALSRHERPQRRVRDAVPPPASHEWAPLQAPIRLAADPDRGTSLSLLRLHAQKRGEARLRRAGRGLGVEQLPHDGTARSRAAPPPHLRALRSTAATRYSATSDTTSCAPSCERTTSTRDDPGVDVLIEGFDADAVALARLLAGEGNQVRLASPEPEPGAARRASRARDRRATRRRPRCRSRRAGDRLPRRLDGRGGAPGRPLRARGARVSCLGDLLLERWAGPTHRHHRHRRQDDDHRAHRLDPPQRRHRHRCQQGSAGREPLADRRSARALTGSRGRGRRRRSSSS